MNALQNQIDRLYRRILMNVAPAKILATDDSGPIHRVQVNLNGGPEIVDQLPVMQFYGVNAHAPVGSDATALFIAGQRSNPVIVATGNQKARLRNLKPGEVALYTDEGDNLKFGRQQAASLTAGNSFGVTTKAVTIKGTDTVKLDSPTTSVTDKLLLAHDPAGPLEACTKQYADSLAMGDGGGPGPPGPAGPAGPAATIAVGTTTTGAPGTPAAVTNAGSSSAAVFDFTIPAGVAGAAGAPGAAGNAATIAIGTTTTGAAGTAAAVTNSGSSSAAVFNFTIPQGVAGATGPQGPPGPGTISGLTTGQLPIAASATTLTSSIAYGTTGNSTIVETTPTGTLAAGVMPAYTGDVASPAGSTVNTLASVNANVGTFQGITFDAKGRATAAVAQGYLTGNQTITLSGDTTGSGTTAIATTTGSIHGNTYPTTLTSGGVLYASSGTAVASSGALAASTLVLGGGAGAAPTTSSYFAIPGGSTVLTGNFNPAAAPTSPVPGYHAVANDGSNTGLLLDTFAAVPLVTGRVTGGTNASPAATPTGTTLLAVSGRGFDTAYTVDQAQMRFSTTELWAGTAHGVGIQWIVTPATTIAPINAMRLGPGNTAAAGGLVVGSSGADMGVGSVNAISGYYVAGASLASTLFPSLTANSLVLGAGAGLAPTAAADWSVPAANVLQGNLNAATPGLSPVPGVYVACHDGQTGGMLVDGYAATPLFVGRAAAGTLASLAATPSGQVVAQFSGRGHTGSGYTSDQVQMRFIATELWSPTANGAQIQWNIVPATTISAIAGMRLGNGTTSAAGGLTVGSPTGGDKGAGTINATTVYAAGVALTSDARHKRDITPLMIDALDLVASIEPKSYKHLPPPQPEPDQDGVLPAMPDATWFDRTFWGFLAADVEAAIAASGHRWDGVITDAEGIQALSYTDLIPVLWRAVQQLRGQVTELRGQLAMRQ